MSCARSELSLTDTCWPGVIASPRDARIRRPRRGMGITASILNPPLFIIAGKRAMAGDAFGERLGIIAG